MVTIRGESLAGQVTYARILTLNAPHSPRSLSMCTDRHTRKRWSCTMLQLRDTAVRHIHDSNIHRPKWTSGVLDVGWSSIAPHTLFAESTGEMLRNRVATHHWHTHRRGASVSEERFGSKCTLAAFPFFFLSVTHSFCLSVGLSVYTVILL